MKFYLTFINPRTKDRERIWFRTEWLRSEYRSDLRADFPTIDIDEYDEPLNEPEVEL